MWNKFVVAVAVVGAVIQFAGCAGKPAYVVHREATGQLIVTGPFPAALLRNDADFQWYSRTYDSYTPDSARTILIGKEWGSTKVLVFLGTWCGDSKREVPRFMKIVDEAGVGERSVSMYGLDQAKRSPSGLEREYGIRLVPTFVFLWEGKQIGRIEEMPRASLEEDLVGILRGSN